MVATTRVAIGVGVVVAALQVWTACAPGWPRFRPGARIFTYHNASAIPIHLGRVPGGPLHAPGARWYNQWVMPTAEPGEYERYTTRVEAVDQHGQLVFCRDFTYREVADAGWTFDIVAGQITCSEPVITPVGR